MLGSDLLAVRLLKAHDASEEDLVLREPPFRATAGAASPLTDLSVVEGRENLAQALILRMLTPRGQLRDLGHSEYGSRLHELIGRNKTSALRNLCRGFVLEVVAQEPRVDDQAVDFSFAPDRETESSFVFTVSVKPRDGGDVLGLSLEVGL